MLVEPAARLVRDDLPSGEVVYPCFMAQWTATDEERARLRFLLDNELPIETRSLIVGNGLAPMSIWLRGEGEV